MKQRTIYTTIALGGGAGVIAASLQIIEKIELLRDKDIVLSCDLNSIFNCSTVLSAWQSSVFGFPNSVVCLILFTLLSTIAIVGATGGTLPRALRLTAQSISLATLGFALWFIEQSIYSIESLCILCLFCLIGLLIVNWGWLRINVADQPPVNGRINKVVQRMVDGSLDSLIWISIAFIVGIAIFLHFN